VCGEKSLDLFSDHGYNTVGVKTGPGDVQTQARAKRADEITNKAGMSFNINKITANGSYRGLLHPGLDVVESKELKGIPGLSAFPNAITDGDKLLEISWIGFKLGIKNEPDDDISFRSMGTGARKDSKAGYQAPQWVARPAPAGRFGY
jgi:hypothetical protein